MNRNWELNMKNDPRQSCNLEGFLFCFHPCATCGTFLHILPSSTSLVKFKLVHFLHFCLVHEIYVKEQAPHFACLLLHLGFCWFWTVWIFWTSIQNLKRKTLRVCFLCTFTSKLSRVFGHPKITIWEHRVPSNSLFTPIYCSVFKSLSLSHFKHKIPFNPLSPQSCLRFYHKSK